MTDDPLRPGPALPPRSARETEDEALLESPPPREAIALHKASDSWRALRILGEFVWGFQLVHHDLWDYDTAAPPLLATIDHDGRRVPVVIAGNNPIAGASV